MSHFLNSDFNNANFEVAIANYTNLYSKYPGTRVRVRVLPNIFYRFLDPALLFSEIPAYPCTAGTLYRTMRLVRFVEPEFTIRYLCTAKEELLGTFVAG